MEIENMDKQNDMPEEMSEDIANDIEKSCREIAKFIDAQMKTNMPAEMSRLRTMLNALGVKWVDNSTKYPEIDGFDINIYRTYYDYKGSSYSVICGITTYGGDEGLLEVWIDREGDPTGWHTADDVLAMMGWEKKEGVLHE